MMKNRIKKLLSYYKPYKKDFFLDLFLSVMTAICMLIIPLIIKYLTSEVVNFPYEKAVWHTSCGAIIILALFLMIYFSKRFSKYQGRIYGRKIEKDIGMDVLWHLEKLSFSFFDTHETGSLISLFTVDIYNLGIMFQNAPQLMLDFILKSGFVLVALFILNKVYGFIVLGFFIILVIFICNFVPKVQKKIKKQKELITELIRNTNEHISGVKTTQSFTGEEIEMKKCNLNYNRLIESCKSRYKMSSFVDATVITFIIGLIPIFTTIGMFFVISGSLSMSNLITSMLFIDILISPLFSIITLMENMQECFAGLNRIFDILELKPQIIDSPNSITLKDTKGSIEFKDVYFKYKNNKEILKNLNININAGEYIALVGSSGSGKSTICNLIPRFYDITSGEILVDNINIKDIKLRSLRQNIGFVHQDTFLFSGTILENIRYGNIFASEDEIIEAAKKAYAHDFIMGLPEKYNTKIGQRGINLSGGQKQRLAIARVFLKNPPILIFDEATSALDNESERYIQKSLEELSSTRTTIVIAHRLSTIKNAGRILVVSNGQIVEEGTHEKLINNNGVYSNFCKLL